MAKGIKKAVESEQGSSVSTAPLKGSESMDITTESSVLKGVVNAEKSDYLVIVYGGEFTPEPQVLSKNVIDILVSKGYKIEYVD